MDSKVIIGKRVKELREAKGISTKDLSYMTGIATVNIENVENGAVSTLLSEIDTLATALDTTLGELVKGV